MAQTIGFNDLNKNKQQPGMQTPGQQSNQQPNQAQVRQKPAGTGFTNLSRVIGANQNNKLGQAVGGGLQNTAGAARSGLQTAQNQFQTNTQQSLGSATDARKAALQNVMDDPSKVGDEQYSQFDQYRQGNYGGPQGLGNETELTGRSQEAEQLGGMVGSEGGRAALLQRYAAKNKPYTSGQSTLDQAILGNTAQGQLKQARRATLGLTGETERGIGSAAQTAQENQQQFAQGTNQGVEDTRTLEEKNLADQVQKQQDLWRKINNIRSGGSVATDTNPGFDLSEQEAGQLGLREGDELTKGTWNAISGGFNDANQINKFNVGSSADFARQQALSRLAGKQYTDSEYSGKENQANQFQQKFGAHDREAFAQASAADRGAANSLAQQLGTYVGDTNLDVENPQAVRAKVGEKLNMLNNQKSELQEQLAPQMTNNQEAIDRLNDKINSTNDYGERQSLEAEKAEQEQQLASRRTAINRIAAEKENVERSRDALFNKMNELGIGRKVHIKKNEGA